jgi:hypothetical protein
MNEFIGSVVWLSVANRLNIFFSYISCDIMYESNSAFMKSEYSHLQYHWCPVAFNVRVRLWISSVRYNSCSDGTAINTRIIAMANVQATSIIWPSSMYRFVECYCDYYVGYYCNNY